MFYSANILPPPTFARLETNFVADFPQLYKKNDIPSTMTECRKSAVILQPYIMNKKSLSPSSNNRERRGYHSFTQRTCTAKSVALGCAQTCT